MTDSHALTPGLNNLQIVVKSGWVRLSLLEASDSQDRCFLVLGFSSGGGGGREGGRRGKKRGEIGEEKRDEEEKGEEGEEKWGDVGKREPWKVPEGRHESVSRSGCLHMPHRVDSESIPLPVKVASFEAAGWMGADLVPIPIEPALHILMLFATAGPGSHMTPVRLDLPQGPGKGSQPLWPQAHFRCHFPDSDARGSGRAGFSLQCVCG